MCTQGPNKSRGSTCEWNKLQCNGRPNSFKITRCQLTMTAFLLKLDLFSILGLAFLALVLVTSCQAKIQVVVVVVAFRNIDPHLFNVMSLTQAPKRPYITTADNVNLTQRQDPSRKQKLQCYERRNFRGDSVRLIDYVHDLYEYNFDNRASSCCFKGM